MGECFICNARTSARLCPECRTSERAERAKEPKPIRLPAPRERPEHKIPERLPNDVVLARMRDRRAKQRLDPAWRAKEAERVRRHYYRTHEARLARRRDYSQRHPEVGREQRRRQHARQRGVGVVVYRRLDIYERDGWRCGICEKPVDRLLRNPDPMAATIDHILPLSHGGPDAPANVRLAHRICNVRRGNRGSVQLRLIA